MAFTFSGMAHPPSTRDFNRMRGNMYEWSLRWNEIRKAYNYSRSFKKIEGICVELFCSKKMMAEEEASETAAPPSEVPQIITAATAVANTPDDKEVPIGHNGGVNIHFGSMEDPKHATAFVNFGKHESVTADSQIQIAVLLHPAGGCNII